MVDTRCDHSDAEDGDVYVGRVVDVDPIHHTVTVEYELTSDGEGGPDREVHAFESQDLAWMQRPTHPIFQYSKVRAPPPPRPLPAPHMCASHPPTVPRHAILFL